MTTDSSDPVADDDTPNRGGAIVSVVVILLFAFLSFVTIENEHLGITIAYLMTEVALISLVIWQACDPFADAAQWVGKKLHLPGSVRGATLDAVASSMPELFSGIFFVVLAIQTVNLSLIHI